MKSYKKPTIAVANIYNFTDCQPLPKYTQKQLIELELVYNRKLKESGFQDVEKWSNNIRIKKVKKIQFIKGHIRWNDRKNQKNFHQLRSETYSYFRVLGLFAYHAPKDMLPEEYRKIIKVYTETGTLNGTLKLMKTEVKQSAICKYLARNFNKILTFVNERFGND